MAFKFELDKLTLEDMFYTYKDDIEENLEVKIDAIGCEKVIKKAVEFSDQLTDRWMDWHKLKCTDEYDDLLDAWDRFARTVVEVAADDVYHNR